MRILVDAATDLACALDAADIERRVAEWREIAALATSHKAIDGGVRLGFDEIDVRALVDLVAREYECCAFLSFALRLEPAAITLEVTGPSNARDMIESLADSAAVAS